MHKASTNGYHGKEFFCSYFCAKITHKNNYLPKAPCAGQTTAFLARQDTEFVINKVKNLILYPG